MSTLIHQIDAALDFLLENDCKRIAGRWVTPDGLTLASDPAQAAEDLRREHIRQQIKRAADDRGLMTR